MANAPPPPSSSHVTAIPPSSYRAKRHDELDALRRKGLAKIFNKHFTSATGKIRQERQSAEDALADILRRKEAFAANPKQYETYAEGRPATLTQLDEMYMTHKQRKNDLKRQERETQEKYRRYVSQYPWYRGNEAMEKGDLLKHTTTVSMKNMLMLDHKYTTSTTKEDIVRQTDLILDNAGIKNDTHVGRLDIQGEENIFQVQVTGPNFISPTTKRDDNQGNHNTRFLTEDEKTTTTSTTMTSMRQEYPSPIFVATKQEIPFCKLHDLIEDKKVDIVCKSFDINTLCQDKRIDIISECHEIETYCQGKKADIDGKVDQVYVLCESKESEITCKCDEITTTCDAKKTELKCKVNVIHDMCETKKYEINECCDDLHKVCEKEKHGIIEKCCEMDDIVNCKKNEIENKCHELTVIVDCKKTDIVNRCYDLDAMLDCKITEMTSKARYLEAMLHRKVAMTLKKIEELDRLLTLKKHQVHERCGSLDRYLNDKDTNPSLYC